MLLQAGAELDDAARRIDDFHVVYLMARRTVFDGPVAAGVGGDIAADKAGVAAAGIAGVEQSLGLGCILQVRCADARLYDGI